MPAAALASVTDYLLECLVANGSSELGSSVPLFICQCLPKSTPPAASLTAAHKVLQQLLSTPAVPSGPSNERLCQHLVALYTPQVSHLLPARAFPLPSSLGASCEVRQEWPHPRSNVTSADAVTKIRETFGAWSSAVHADHPDIMLKFPASLDQPCSEGILRIASSAAR